MLTNTLNWSRRWLGWNTSLLVTIVLPLYLWLREPSIIGEVVTLRDNLVILAKVGAFTGFAAFMWSLVLGARLKWVDRLFLGLDKAYKAHHLLGIYSFIAILVHALAITAAIFIYAPMGALSMWVPGANFVVTLGVVALLGMIILLTATVLFKLKHQTFLRLHRLLGVLLIPAAMHTFLSSGHMLENSALRRYMLVLTFVGAVSYLYHSVFGAWVAKKYPYRVSAVNHLGTDITEVILEPDWHPLTFRPGQFGYLSMRDEAVSNESHPFSFSSSKHDYHLGFVIKNLGDYTSKIGEVRPGARATVDGAYGNFSYLNTTNSRQIWIAGGIGVTPFLSMVRSFSGRGRIDVDFFYCTKNDEEAIFLDEFRNIDRSNAKFKLHHICEERQGFLSAEKVAELSKAADTADIFICGPPPMLNGLRQQFEAMGVGEGRMHYEEFSF